MSENESAENSTPQETGQEAPSQDVKPAGAGKTPEQKEKDPIQKRREGGTGSRKKNPALAVFLTILVIIIGALLVWLFMKK